MNSRLLLALLVLALVGTTWLLVTLVRLPPMGAAPAAPDTAAVADPKAVINPLAPRRGGAAADTGAVGDTAVGDTSAAPGDTLGGPSEASAGEGGRP